MWIDALIRRAEAGGAFACLIRRGDRDAGSVLVSVRAGDDIHLYQPERNLNGDRVWRAERLDAESLQDRIAQRTDFDPDLNVIEVEDRDGRHFIDEPVIAPEARSQQSREPDQAGPVDAAAAARALFRDR